MRVQSLTATWLGRNDFYACLLEFVKHFVDKVTFYPD